MTDLNPNKFLSDDELKRFLIKRKDAKGTRNGIIMGLLLYTGARQSEIAAIKKEHIYSGGVYIFGKKNSKNGFLTLPPVFYKELIAYVKYLADGVALFPYNTSTLRRIWYKFTPNHNKGLHCLRHNYALRLFQGCKDINSVKNALRHKQITNTQVYVDYIDSRKKQHQNIMKMWKVKLDDVA